MLMVFDNHEIAEYLNGEQIDDFRRLSIDSVELM